MPSDAGTSFELPRSEAIERIERIATALLAAQLAHNGSLDVKDRKQAVEYAVDLIAVIESRIPREETDAE